MFSLKLTFSSFFPSAEMLCLMTIEMLLTRYIARGPCPLWRTGTVETGKHV